MPKVTQPARGSTRMRTQAAWARGRRVVLPRTTEQHPSLFRVFIKREKTKEKGKEAFTQKPVCSYSVLFTINTKWRRPECRSTDEPINDTECTHTMADYSAAKRNQAPKLENRMPGEGSQSQRHLVYDSIYMKCLKAADVWRPRK